MNSSPFNHRNSNKRASLAKFLGAFKTRQSHDVAGEKIQFLHEMRINNVLPLGGGILDTMAHSHMHNYHLVLRPDDIWISIVLQFIRHVDNHPTLPHTVYRIPKAQLKPTIHVGLATDDRTLAAELMRVCEGLVGRDVAEWVLPSLSTTTTTDVVVAATAVLGGDPLNHGAALHGARPSPHPGAERVSHVTLAGAKSDWSDIRERVGRLRSYASMQLVAWSHLLDRVLAHFLTIFDCDGALVDSEAEFWGRMCTIIRPWDRQGACIYTGWMTTFCVFDMEGRWLGPRLNPHADYSTDIASLRSAEFWATVCMQDRDDDVLLGRLIDGIWFHNLDPELTPLPNPFSELEILVSDSRSSSATSHEPASRRCILKASVLGIRVSTATSENESDTVRPSPTWWIYNRKIFYPGLDTYVASHDEGNAVT
ncbi:unnamed protein product [Mycena citricolor]|uniref:Uncharacterized protein n=1 Tax=Mycena citricolor TaxID=2018698 RepID=A0AAD2K834_9AGAR|nr:unnamed protein product [Mycena citricolor]